MASRVEQPDTDADVELRALLNEDKLRSFIMVAGAGSGKTTSLVKALDHVIRSRGSDLRRRTQKVACVTYTEIAAGEIYAEVGSDPLAHVSTIHSFLWSVVRPFQKDIAAWVRARAEDKLRALQDEQAGFGPRIQQPRRDKVASDIQKYDAQLRSLGSVRTFTYGVASNYGAGVLGHQDVLSIGPELIRQRPLLAQLVARQYPFLFVDESQDTDPDVVACLKHVAQLATPRFCLGFFGDPMQQIYVRGAGNITPEDGWSVIPKPDNFRSPARVLEVMNAVRSADDGLTQVTGLPPEKQRDGSVHFFVLPADEKRTQNLQLVHSWLDAHSSDGQWTSSDPNNGAKVLVIAHRMAAQRLGFEGLYAAFHDSGSHSLSEGFDEGTAWPLTPFLTVLLPFAEASEAGVVALLRRNSPTLGRDQLASEKVNSVLASLRQYVDQIRRIVGEGGPGSVGKALDVALAGQLLNVDPRLAAARSTDQSESDVVMSESTVATLANFLDCDIVELRGYQKYARAESPYATHQGVKGSEYPRVLVVLDDEEGRHNQFSYDKLFGLKPPSDTDLKNRLAGKETIVERTRRLFYVCTSRATEALAVVLYAADVDAAAATLRQADLPGLANLMTLSDLDAALV